MAVEGTDKNIYMKNHLNLKDLSKKKSYRSSASFWNFETLIFVRILNIIDRWELLAIECINIKVVVFCSYSFMFSIFIFSGNFTVRLKVLDYLSDGIIKMSKLVNFNFFSYLKKIFMYEHQTNKYKLLERYFVRFTFFVANVIMSSVDCSRISF